MSSKVCLTNDGFFTTIHGLKISIIFKNKTIIKLNKITFSQTIYPNVFIFTTFLPADQVLMKVWS